MAAVNSCLAPRWLSIQSAWKPPRTSAANPVVSSAWPQAQGFTITLSGVRGKSDVAAYALISVGSGHGRSDSSETRTLGSHVSPPSTEALNLTVYPLLSSLSRRSYHVTPTTPRLFTATFGMKLSLF